MKNDDSDKKDKEDLTKKVETSESAKSKSDSITSSARKSHKKKRKIKTVKVFGKRMLRDRFLLYATNVFFVLLIVGAAGYYYFNFQKDYLSQNDAKKTSEDFINSNLLAPGTTASVTDISSDKCLYEIKVDLGNDQVVDSYMTKDGKIFFTNALDIEEVEGQAEGTDDTEVTEEQTEVETKNDKPVVEMFVMSHCPYGTQIEKGMIPVVETLGDKVDFKLKFVDYAMHDKKEMDEQLNQYCIQKNTPEKLTEYLSCFLQEDAEGQSNKCASQVGISTDELASCASDADKEFKVTENYENKDTWKGTYPPFDVYKEDNEKYGVGGSPTLVINETTLSTGRDSASLLSAVCSGFNEKPGECDTKLSSDVPAPGFGSGTTDSTAAGSCN